MPFPMPEVSPETMQLLRDDTTSPEFIQEQFEQLQPHIVAGLKNVMGDGDEYESVVSSMALMCRALETEFMKRLA